MNEPDYPRLDPDERRNKIMALLSAALGFVSLCAGLIPICGIAISLAGIISGLLGRNSENRKIAILGIILSILGILIAIIYFILLKISGKSTLLPGG